MQHYPHFTYATGLIVTQVISASELLADVINDTLKVDEVTTKDVLEILSASGLTLVPDTTLIPWKDDALELSATVALDLFLEEGDEDESPEAS